MNQHVYTFIGSCHAVEHALANDSEVSDALALLASVRLAILDSLGSGNAETDLESALRAHVVSLLEAVELLRKSSKYQALDSTLIELMNNYYNISDAIMGGGGGSSYEGSGSTGGESTD